MNADTARTILRRLRTRAGAVASIAAAVAAVAMLAAAQLTFAAVTVAAVTVSIMCVTVWLALRPRLGSLTAAVAIAISWGAVCGAVMALGTRDVRDAAAFGLSGFLFVLAVTMLALPVLAVTKAARFTFRRIAARRHSRRPDTAGDVRRQPARTSRTTPRKRSS